MKEAVTNPSTLSEILSLYRPVRDRAEHILNNVVKKSGVHYDFVSARLKINKEVLNKLHEGKPLSEIYDIVGTRIVVQYIEEIKTVEKDILERCPDLRKLRQDDCIVSSIYDPCRELPPKFYEDYISQPRGRVGYRSLHLVVFCPIDVPSKFEHFFPRRHEGVPLAPVEIQIRTVLLHAWEEKDWHYNYKPLIESDPFIQGQFYSIAGMLWHIDKEFMDIKSDFEKRSEAEGAK